jgi:hypothetical protein
MSGYARRRAEGGVSSRPAQSPPDTGQCERDEKGVGIWALVGCGKPVLTDCPWQMVGVEERHSPERAEAPRARGAARERAE